MLATLLVLVLAGVIWLAWSGRDLPSDGEDYPL